MKEFIIRDGKKLRLGYTTGSCAAAAAKAAAWMLLSGSKKESIRLLTPKGMELALAVEDIYLSPDCVRCAIRKDSGDDPDITRDTLIYAEVRKTETVGIVIDGGQGVGRVTKPGLDQPVGAAAINSVPRRMIQETVEEVCGLLGYTGGLYVVISAPDGETLAKKTFNPRLGIEGGISILGTTGIVEPMSEQALVDTIHVELRQRRAGGADYVLLGPRQLRRRLYQGCHGHRPRHGGDDLQLHRRRAGDMPGAGLQRGAAHRSYRQAGKAGGRYVEHPLPLRRLPHGHPDGLCRRRGAARRCGGGDALLRHL